MARLFSKHSGPIKHPSRLVEIWFATTTVVAIGSFLMVKIYDLDMWWNLAIGRDILNTFSVPDVNKFSALNYGMPYHDSHWLFQVLAALFYKAAGMTGVQMLMVTCWSLAFLFSYRSMNKETPIPVRFLLLFLAAMAASERFLPRPEIITYLMIPLYYHLLERRRYFTVRLLLLFGLLQAVWTNSHGLFVIGPFMVLCNCAGATIDAFRGKETFEAKRSWLLLAVVTSATLISPYGWHNWAYAVRLAREVSSNAPPILKRIRELSPTFGSAARSAPAFWFFAVVLFLTFVAAVLSAARQTLALKGLLMVTGLAIASCTGRRNTAIFVLIAAPFITEHLTVVRRLSARLLNYAAWVFIPIFLCWAYLPVSGRYYETFAYAPTSFGFGATKSFFPYRLPGLLKHAGFRGQIYNDDYLGGFYMFYCYPAGIPLFDGRWEVYDQKQLERVAAAAQDLDLWRKAVAAYNIKGVLLQHESVAARGLLPHLVRDPAWRLVYLDYAASFWVRKDLAPIFPAISLNELPSSGGRKLSLYDYIDMDWFLSSTRAENLRIENLKQSLRLGARTEFLLEELGRAQIAAGLNAEAEATFRKLNRHYPDNVTALIDLAVFAGRRGDFLTARNMLERALSLDPANETIQLDLRKIQADISRSR